MASHLGEAVVYPPVNKTAARTIEPAAKRGVRFLLHTGLIQPNRVDVCFVNGSFQMEREVSISNIWRSSVFPPDDYKHYYKLYLDANKPAVFLKSQWFSQLPYYQVHHDILSSNLPSSYSLGFMYHMQDIYASTERSSCKTRVAELNHLMYPDRGNTISKGLRECFPKHKEELKTTALLKWINYSIQNVTSTSQFTVLSILVAYLHSDFEIVKAMEEAELRKLIGSIHKFDKYHVDYWEGKQLKQLVVDVLKKLKEYHWLYVVLHCYPLFDRSYVMQFKTKAHDKPPSLQCISDVLLPRLNKIGYVQDKTMIIQDINAFVKKKHLHDKTSTSTEKHQREDHPTDVSPSGDAKDLEITDVEPPHAQAESTSPDKGASELQKSIKGNSDRWTEDPPKDVSSSGDAKDLEITDVEPPHAEADSTSQDEGTSELQKSILENSNRWVSHRFCVHLEAEHIKEVSISIEEGGKRTVQPLNIPMTLRKIAVNLPFSKKTWWSACISIQLTEKTCYTYKYSYTHDSRWLGLLRYKTSCNEEQGERTVKQLENEDIFNYNLTIEKTMTGHLLHSLYLAGIVNKDNIKDHLFDDHAEELKSLSTNVEDTSFLKDVQSYITSLIEEAGLDDGQVVFLARLLGNCSRQSAMPDLVKIAKTILRAFQHCTESISSSLEKQANKRISSDLTGIVIRSLRAVKGSWTELVVYTFPAISASELCALHRSWNRGTEKTDHKLTVADQKEVLSVCLNHYEPIHSDKLISLVFQSITDVKLLLQVLNQSDKAHIFQDEHGYRSWVKDALQKQMLSLQQKDIHDIWKMVAETDVVIMQMLAKEFVFESLAHSKEWSIHGTKFMSSLLTDDSFWQTPPEDQVSSTFLVILETILGQKNRQAGIDYNLEVISKPWVTKWVSPDNLKKLVTAIFEKQLQSKSQSAQLMHKIYVFLAIVHSTQWLSELPGLVEQLDTGTLAFISQSNKLKTLLEIVFKSPKSDSTTLSDAGMKLLVQHLIMSIQSTVMGVSGIYELLKPYAPKGIIDLHSQHAVDVLSKFIEIMYGAKDDVFPLLENKDFWTLVFRAQGKMAKELQNNWVYKAVVNTLISVEQNFFQKKVTVGFITRLEQYQDCLVQLCGHVNTDAEYAKKRHQTFKEPCFIIKANEEMLHQLETFLVFCSKFKGILSETDLDMMRKELHLRRQHVDAESQTCLTSLVDPGYWGFLSPFLEIAKGTLKLSSSTVFSNICLFVVESIQTKKLGSAPLTAQDSSSDMDSEVEELSDAETEDQLEDEPESKSLKLDEFSELVSSKCLPVFEELRSDIAKGCKTMTVHNMKIMFAGVIKAEELHQELENMQIFKPPKQSMEYLKTWINLEEMRVFSKQLHCLFMLFEVHKQKTGDLMKNVETLVDIFDPENDGKTIEEVHMAVKSIQDVDKKFNDDDWCTINALVLSKDLILFLKPIIDDDLRNLTDAVEERSDSLINESTVSDLIEVQRYMGPFLRIEVMDTPQKLIKAIAKSKQLEIKNVSEKIRTCNAHFHALKNLYNNIAQRGEMTKKIIRSALEKGWYEFVLSEDGELCKVSMSYTRDDGSCATYEQDELNDLRSRALLMVNSRMSHQPERRQGDNDDSHLSKNLQEFIQCIDEVIEIVALCSRLSNSGHYHFRRFHDSVRDLESLLSLKDRLEREDCTWRVILEDARGEFYFLNFFHARQLWLLDQFFRGEVDASREVVNLFHYVNPDISVDINLREYYESLDDTEDLRERVFQIGAALKEVFSDVVSPVRDIVCLKPHQKATVESTVQHGTVFVAELDPDSTNSIPVLMTLLRNTTGKYPQANHVLFCHSENTWEEVYLLLQRCRKASTMPQKDLYALINVEQLTTEIQFMLVDEVRGIQEEGEEECPFLLAIICRGGSHHHIIDQFTPHYTHRIQGMTSNEMQDCLEQGWPDVEVITSEVPGLGKSEYISCRASEKGKGCHLLPMGGPQTKTDLVRQLLQRPPSEFQLLHIDIRTTSNPSLIDSFIFELLVVGMVVAGTFLCELNTSDILIEIANTQQNSLSDSLTNCCNFKRRHIEWDNYESFLVSEEVNSPVQVVCSYLNAVNDGSLDAKQITFSSSSKGSLLPEDKCRHLLRTHFSPTSKMAFTTVNMFLNVLATELKKLSASHYFTEEALHIMLGKDEHCVRSDLFKALDAVAQEFSSRSVETGGTQSTTGRDAAEALNELHQGPSVTAEKMVARVKGMVQWADSNHLMVVFNQQDTQTLSTLYRLLSQVPKSVKNLFEQQLDKELPDYQKVSQDQLQSVLEKICRNTRDPFARSKLGHLDKGYALTPDNLMKMVLIYMRIKSRIPVVIMGETGCGKTTLITYLARVCEVPFYVLNFHAGIEIDTIIDFIHSKKKEAEKNLDGQIWCFLDEINTCDHLGLLSEVICHQSCCGELLPINLVFLAACNPYSMRQGDIQTSGLTDKLVTDEQSKLVYRVNPLPEALMDYVWDYGALDAKDEKAYIERMIKGNIDDDLVPLFVDLLIMSQEFIKSTMKNNYSVSLRDVNRCKHLAHWMTKMLKDKKLAKVEHNSTCGQEYETRALILALAHCYHSRLTTANDRKLYREEMSKIFKTKNHPEFSEGHIEEVIKCEQLDILNRMELEEGIAKNEALRENVFVVLISILNRIPVFLVGKPGCSKSLSMQLIRTNLRGPDSKDKYFKTLPAVYVVSYQGSESSTSEGIIKVFEKANRYKEHNPDIIPVVLLDEIGLAENSSFNPLKVLHSLLEPSTGDFPEMAVVGISNWALDAAKMNRAVHLSRPEPNADDLFETAKSIRDENSMRSGMTRGKQKHEHNLLLKKLAEAYHSHHQSQARKNFHGLRDYYSLIKSIAMSSSQRDAAISLEIGLLRNFGGNQEAMTGIMNDFMDTMDVDQSPDSRPTTIKLIEDNLEDRFARHLMLITSGDSALSIIEEVLSKMKKKYISLLGSRFDDDLSEEYNYRILSEIILCMEEGYILVLRDLDNVYSSLYDMLNQNYTIVSKKRHCRVALGAYSNPMCHVHQDFRCIVVIDQQNVDYSDPPLLNRFEKQTLTFMDVVNDQQKAVIASLQKWVEDVSTIPNMQFTPKQAFLGYHNDTLPSLVFSHCRDVKPEEMEVNKIVQLCKHDLVKIAPPDAVLRSSKSNLAVDEVHKLQDQYLKLPVNGGLRHYLKLLLEMKNRAQAASIEYSLRDNPMKLIVYTFSSIHTDLRTCLADMPSFQVEKLSKFTSERQLTAALQRFNCSNDQFFILQCKTSLDAKHMLLAKCLIDRWMGMYKTDKMYRGVKHACIIVHVERDQVGMASSFPWQFNFLCGWQQVTLDVLEEPELQIKEIIKMSIEDICAKTVDVGNVIKFNLPWCFTRIAYTDQSKDVMEILELIRRITESPKLIDCFCRTVLQDIQKDGVDGVVDEPGINKGAWQVSVACEHELLVECSSFNYALVEHVKRKIRHPLFKIVFFLERHNAWNSFFSQAQQKDIWKTMFCNPLIFDVRSHALPEPNGVESCPIHKTLPLLEFPFFSKLYDIIEEQLKCLMADAREKLIAENSYIDEAEMTTELTQVLRDRLPEAIKYDLALHVDDEFMEENLDLYLNDLCNVFSVDCVSQMSQEARVHATRLLVKLQDSALVEGLSTIEQLSYWHISLRMKSDLVAAELQLLHMYQVATGNDCVQLLGVIADSIDSQDVNPCSDDEKSIASGNFLDASDILLSELEEDLEHDQVSDTSSFVSAFESYYSDGSVTSDKADIPLKLSLVSHVCKSLLPTEVLLEHCQSQNIWARRINNILLLAASIGVRPQELHYLHLCKDFVNLLAVPNNLPDDKLATLGELIADIDDNTLDSERVFEFVLEIIHEVSNEDPEGSVQQLFLTKYFGRCLESNNDTPLLNDILRLLITEKGELIKGSRLVLFRVIRDEIEDREHESVYTKVIREGVNPNDLSDNLVTLDEVLLELPSGENHHFAVLCCDLIEENGFHDLTALRMMSGGSSSHVVTAMKACRLLEKADKCSLQLVCALAFLNKLFRVFAEILIDNIETFPETGEDFALLKHIRDVVCSLKQCDRELNVQLWILRYLSQQDSNNDLHKLMSSLSREVEFLKGINLTDLCSRSGIGFNPMSYMDLNGEITKALADLQLRNKKVDMRTVMGSLKSSPKQRIAFMAVLAEYYYFAGKTKYLTDSEKSQAKWIAKEIEKASLDETPWWQLMKAVLGLSDFRGRMQLSKQSKVSDVRLASVLLHISAVAVGNHSAGQQVRNFLQFLCPSEQLNDLHFPGAATLARKANQQTRSVICKCSQWLVQSLGQGSHRVKCPTCGRKINWPDLPGAVKEEQETAVGYKYPPVESWENLEQTGNISILSRFIIDFLVHGCLFIASELFPPESNMVGVCSAAELDLRMTKLWDTMAVVLRAGRQDTCVLLHCIIKEISPMLTDTQYTFVSAANRDQQEIEIDKVVQKILSNSTLCRKQFLQDSFEAFGTPVDKSLQHQLQELDNIDGDTCKLVSRSVRQKRQPSLEDLKACFCDRSKNVERFPFLHLVLSKYNALKYVGNLSALLEWNKLVSARLSQRREKRKYADRPVRSLIEAFPSMSDPWTAFRDAAKEVCDGWTELTGETTKPEYTTEDSDIIKCLMPTGKEKNTLKQMIKTLQEVQNKFLTEALEIAVTKECPAISFLIKENHLAALQTKPLDQVGKKDIITNPWNDQCLCYHDINTEYGQGTEITYEFNQIEMEVAFATVVNKMILTDGCALEGFIFSDDLYHSSTAILEEMSTKVKQETLPKDIANLVNQGERRKQGTSTNDLLQQLEVLMGLIKRTSGEPEATLQDYISKWSAILTIESPELFASIKLKHIVSLYQQLEVLLATATVQTLDETFQIKLPVKSEHELERCCSERPGDALILIRDILKRFVFRYLRARHSFEPDCKKRLRDLLKDMSGHDRVMPLLNKDLQLCHIVKLLEFFDRKIKQKEKEKPTKMKRKPISKRGSHAIGIY